MNTYLKSFISTLVIVVIAFVVATISDINDLFELDIILFMILVPSIIISTLFWGIFRKISTSIILSLIACVVYFFVLIKSRVVGVDPFGILIYTGFIYVPLIILGSMFSAFLRAFKTKKGTYI